MTSKSKLIKKVLYFDCYSGISGDMTLGALLDLGLELDALKKMLDCLSLDGYCLETEKVKRGGISGTRALVKLDDGISNRRNLPEIIRLIEDAKLPMPVKSKSCAIFQALAEAEAEVHGTTVDQIHFHEVGAVDAIVDIVGTAAALYLLEVDRIYCSPLPLGRGEVNTEHGRLPLPAPATLQLLAKKNVPICGSDVNLELVTPTGAAIVTTLAEHFGVLPQFSVSAVGYGAGSYDTGHPNYLRLIIGNSKLAESRYEEEILSIETNIDDLNPEIFGYLMDRLFAAGALDVFVTPIQMKKNRPAAQLTVLADVENKDPLQSLIFYETTSLGLRVSTVRKVMLPRESITVETDWGPVRVKYSPTNDEGFPLHFAPEYADCCSIALSSGLPLKEIYRLVEHLFRNSHYSS